MPVRRGYRQACGIARGLDVVGERWALLVVRELLLGPKRFTDLQAALPAASPNALADRLRELTEAGVIRRGQLPPPASAKVYELTDWGRRLEPILIELGTWALAAQPAGDQVFVSADSAMLTIRTYYVPAGKAAADVTLRIELRDHGPGRVFGVRLTRSGAEVTHVAPESPDAVLTSTTSDLLTAFGKRTLPAKATITGDRSAVRRLVEGIRFPAADRG